MRDFELHVRLGIGGRNAGICIPTLTTLFNRTRHLHAVTSLDTVRIWASKLENTNFCGLKKLITCIALLRLLVLTLPCMPGIMWTQNVEQLDWTTE